MGKTRFQIEKVIYIPLCDDCNPADGAITLLAQRDITSLSVCLTDMVLSSQN